MSQVSRNLTGWDCELEDAGYLIHDRDTKYTTQFDAIIQTSGIKPIKLPLERIKKNQNGSQLDKSHLNSL